MKKNKFDLKFLSLLIFVLISSLLISFFLSKKLNPVKEKYIESEIEVSVIYIGCSFCPAANDPKIKDMLQIVYTRIDSVAEKKGYASSLIGISNEVNIKSGLDYLSEIGDFNEISLGNAMRNSALQRYVWENYQGPLSAATPQVLIVRREFNKRVISKNESISPEIIDEKILTRAIGIDNLIRLSNNSSFFRQVN